MPFSDENINSIEDNELNEENIEIYNGLMKKFPDLIVILSPKGKILEISGITTIIRVDRANK